MQVALLRGINVGGKNIVPMKQLAALFVDAGCRNVQTHIQSGNVIFEASPKILAKLATQVTSGIEKQFGCRIPVVLRTVAELDAVVKNNPYLQKPASSDTAEDMLHVYFLAKAPSAEQVAQLDSARSLPDGFIVQGREIFLQLPNGMARTKLTNAYFDSRLSTVSTARNWRTVKKLRELMGP